jgi:hypothetical protein
VRWNKPVYQGRGSASRYYRKCPPLCRVIVHKTVRTIMTTRCRMWVGVAANHAQGARDALLVPSSDMLPPQRMDRGVDKPYVWLPMPTAWELHHLCHFERRSAATAHRDSTGVRCVVTGYRPRSNGAHGYAASHARITHCNR